jgi:hypothetical protein
MEIVLGDRELVDRVNVGYVAPRDHVRAKLVSFAKRAIIISLGQENDPAALYRPRFKFFCPAMRCAPTLR